MFDQTVLSTVYLGERAPCQRRLVLGEPEGGVQPDFAVSADALGTDPCPGPLLYDHRDCFVVRTSDERPKPGHQHGLRLGFAPGHPGTEPDTPPGHLGRSLIELHAHRAGDVALASGHVTGQILMEG